MALFWRRHPVRDEDLSALLDGELDAARRERVESHLETCEACRETLAELRAVRSALAALPRAQAPRSFALRQADIEAQAVPPAPAGLGRAPALLGGVAMVAFVAFFVLVGVDLSDGSSEPTAAPGTSMAFDESDLGEVENGDAAAQGGDRDAPTIEGDGEADLMAPPAEDGETAPDQPVAAAPDMADPERPAEEVQRPTAESDSDASLRAAQAAAAAIGLVAIGSLALVWWRRRVAN